MVPVSATESRFKTKANYKQLFAELFFKIGVLKNFCNIHKKMPVLESHFSKVAGLKGHYKKIKINIY